MNGAIADGQLRTDELRFQRHWFYIVAGVLGWRVFWELADRSQHNPRVQLIAWFTVVVAVAIAEAS